MYYILVVDDYATNGIIVKQALDKDRFTVKTVTSGQKAIDYLNLHARVDLILLDINMPEMDGIETLMHIKKHFSDIPVMFLSGQADRDKVIKGFKYGVEDVLTKPVIPNVIRDRVDLVLRGESTIQNQRKLRDQMKFDGGDTGIFGIRRPKNEDDSTLADVLKRATEDIAKEKKARSEAASSDKDETKTEEESIVLTEESIEEDTEDSGENGD